LEKKKALKFTSQKISIFNGKNDGKNTLRKVLKQD